MKNDQPPLFPNNVYHICTHAVNNNNFFREPENYGFFLKRYQDFITPIADTYSHCLLPNHFHIIIKIKTEKDLLDYFQITDPTKDVELPQKPLLDISLALSYQFSHLFNSYTKSYNKMYARRGSLFERKFRRTLISDRTYFKTAILYVLTNSVHHGFTSNFREWTFSSYWETVFEEQPTFIKRDTVLKIFGNKENFEKELDAFAKSKNTDNFE